MIKYRWLRGVMVVGLIAAVGYIYAMRGVSTEHATADPSTSDATTVAWTPSGEQAVATFAAGCFWCIEPVYQEHRGVLDVVVGYAREGQLVTDEAVPSYREVASGQTAYKEAIQVTYDPQAVSYDELLSLLWTHIDPTDDGGQFVDRGRQYTTVIYYHDDTQRERAVARRDQLDASGVYEQPIVTEIVPYGTFAPAEEYHQDYYKKSAQRYNRYKQGSGRPGYFLRTQDAVEEVLGSSGDGGERGFDPASRRQPDDAVIRETLTPLQYKVTQRDGTERAFDNPYWDNKQQGIYVDIISGEPLYSSADKYVSGTGRPSFTQPIDPASVTLQPDNTLWSRRTEVRSRYADSHLGHVFDDGPADRGGKRYCMNSAAMRFVPLDEMDEQGYGERKDAVVENT